MGMQMIASLMVLLGFAFLIVPLAVSLANASNTFANIGGIFVLFGGTLVSFYLMTLIARKPARPQGGQEAKK